MTASFSPSSSFEVAKVFPSLAVVWGLCTAWIHHTGEPWSDSASFLSTGCSFLHSQQRKMILGGEKKNERCLRRINKMAFMLGDNILNCFEGAAHNCLTPDPPYEDRTVFPTLHGVIALYLCQSCSKWSVDGVKHSALPFEKCCFIYFKKWLLYFYVK